MSMRSHSSSSSKGQLKVYRVVILGDGGVGKSALTIQFVSHQFMDYHDPTIEEEYRAKCVIDDESCRLHILDTAGQHEFSAMKEQYMRKGEGFILCYSIADSRSFDEIPHYIRLIQKIRHKDDVPFVIVGNKHDLSERRAVPVASGIQLAQRYNCPFYETSAATRFQVDDVFHSIIREIRGPRQGGPSLSSEPSGKSAKLGKVKLFFRRLSGGTRHGGKS